MADLIDREALFNSINADERGKTIHTLRSGKVLLSLEIILENLHLAPTVDAVEVVRCKYCKHRRDDEDYASGHYCVKRPSNGGYFCEDNDFCSYGEKKG